MTAFQSVFHTAATQIASIRSYLWILLLSLLCAFLTLAVHPQGRGGSVFAPLLFLPLVLAILTCRYPFVLALGFLLGCISIASAFSPGVFLSPAVFAAPAGQSALLHTVLLIALAALGGGYIQHMQQESETLTRQLQEADELLRISSRVGTTGRLEDAIEIVLLALHQQYNYSTAGILLWEENAGQLLVYGKRNDAGLLPVMRTTCDRAVAEAFWKNPAYHQTESPPVPLNHLAAGSRSLAVLPMSLPANRFMGALFVGFAEPDSLSEEDMEWLSTFTRGIALPLSRTRAHEELEHLAYTDPMTGLANYRAFRAHLHEEFVRARRYHHPLAMLMVDVDWFKKVNDRYGHPAGDAVLRYLAGLLKMHFRINDLPARYGGEEFVILCLETDEAEALAAAERLRAAVEKSKCLLPDGQCISLTISIGVAVYSQEEMEDSDLIAQADAALYQAKQSGRNSVACLNNVPIVS